MKHPFIFIPLFLFLSCPSVLHAELYYHSTKLENLGGNKTAAYDININGEIVGFSENIAGLRHAVLWKKGTIQDLGTLGGIESYAFGINDSGHIAGVSKTASNHEHAFLWIDGTMTDLGVLGSGNFSEAYDINNSGQIAGNASVSGWPSVYHAFIWENGVMQDLGNLGSNNAQMYVRAMNDEGGIVGFGDFVDNPDHAFAFLDGSFIDLGTLGGRRSEAFGINNLNQVVGSAEFSMANHLRTAFLWQNGTMQDIDISNDSVSSRATGINDSGQIVGYIEFNGLFRWQNGTMLAIASESILSGPVPECTGASVKINNNGLIVCRDFLLTPAFTDTSDSDGDGLPDEWEINYFSGLGEIGSGDPDADGLINIHEYEAGTNPNNFDTDNDGLSDGIEVNILDTNPANYDTDGNGTPDGAEDFDLDELTNIEEILCGSDFGNLSSRCSKGMPFLMLLLD